jgi:glycolate oxidase iron-sulfur subunit
VYLCTGCGTCREVCPKKVNVPEIVNLIRARIFQQRPDLVPKPLLDVRDIIVKHSLAFEPWEDPQEKAESRDTRVKALGLPSVPDRIVTGADVLFYPGCQAEERAQEVKEAAKYILSYFGVNYTMLDRLTCCGLPSKLMGDDETARSLAAVLHDKVKSLGVKKIVTTCAGCTSNLSDISTRDGWGVPVYHLIEFLAEEVGFDKVSRPFKGRGRFSPVKVTVHDPCHLIRHTSRQIVEHGRTILNFIPGVTVEESGLADSCCGGGGMVGYHSRDVADAVVRDNIAAISATEADTLVAPCPLCTAQIESNLFRSGSTTEVEDLSVFIARRLPQKR